MTRTPRTAVAAAALLAALTAGASRARPAGAADLPAVMVWAWERPERFHDLGPDRGVAFLAATHLLTADTIVSRPRLNALDVPPATPLVAVARIETDRVRPPRFAAERTVWLAGRLAAMRALPGVRAIQVDFDATRSERGFYRDLLAATRAALGPATPLSITALASWCMGDAWIDDLPIDEAVPMLFRMGATEDRQFRAIGIANAWRAARCRASAGISTDEPIALPLDGRRVYIFHPAPWTDATVAAALTGRIR